MQSTWRISLDKTDPLAGKGEAISLFVLDEIIPIHADFEQTRAAPSSPRA